MALPGYKKVVVRDIVYQPGAKTISDAMSSDMVCQCMEGELRLDHRNGHVFTAKKGEVWTCFNREPEDVTNIGSTSAVMRVVALLTA